MILRLTQNALAAASRLAPPWLWAIAGVSLVVRFGYHVANQDSWFLWGDSWTYHNTARLAADGNGLVEPHTFRLTGEFKQAADHPPLWIYVLTVATLLGIESPASQLFINIALGVATVIVIGKLGTRVGGERVGGVAAGFAAMYPNLISWNAELLSETLATFLVTLTVLLSFNLRDGLTTKRIVAVVAAGCLAGLSRSEAILLLPMVVLPQIYLAARHRPAVLQRAVIVTALTGALLLGPPIAYNMARFEAPVLISTGLGRAMMSGACDQAFEGKQAGFWTMRCLGPVANEGRAEGLDESEQDQLYRKRALEYYKAQGTELPGMLLIRVGRMSQLYRPDLLLWGDQVAESRPWWISASGIFGYYGLLVFAVAGSLLLRQRKQPLWPLLAPLVIVSVSAALVFGTTRYRSLAEGVLVVIAAVGFERVVMRRIRKRVAWSWWTDRSASAHAIVAGACMAVIALLGMWFIRATDSDLPPNRVPQGNRDLIEQVVLPD